MTSPENRKKSTPRVKPPVPHARRGQEQLHHAKRPVLRTTAFWRGGVAPRRILQVLRPSSCYDAQHSVPPPATTHHSTTVLHYSRPSILQMLLCVRVVAAQVLHDQPRKSQNFCDFLIHPPCAAPATRPRSCITRKNVEHPAESQAERQSRSTPITGKGGLRHARRGQEQLHHAKRPVIKTTITPPTTKRTWSVKTEGLNPITSRALILNYLPSNYRAVLTTLFPT